MMGLGSPLPALLDSLERLADLGGRGLPSQFWASGRQRHSPACTRRLSTHGAARPRAWAQFETPPGLPIRWGGVVVPYPLSD